MAIGRALARALGVFSLALGILQLVAPGAVARFIGVRPKPDRETGMRAVGARELGAAAGLLASPRPAPFMWMRVAGDVIDLALLARAADAGDNRRRRVGAATAAVAGITAVDLLGSVLVTREAARNGNGREHRNGHTPELLDQESGARRVTNAVSINLPRSEVYAFWRDLTNLPRFMHHLESVHVDDPAGMRSHWTAKAPVGRKVEWDAEVIEDRPNERIAWRSVDGAVANAGTVDFEDAPGGRGTNVVVNLEYSPPGGPLGVVVAKLTGEEPEQQTADDLRRLKQVLETGDIVVSDAMAGGRKVRQRPAQPVESLA